jgi:hypothetical protein
MGLKVEEQSEAANSTRRASGDHKQGRGNQKSHRPRLPARSSGRTIRELFLASDCATQFSAGLLPRIGLRRVSSLPLSRRSVNRGQERARMSYKRSSMHKSEGAKSSVHQGRGNTPVFYMMRSIRRTGRSGRSASLCPWPQQHGRVFEQERCEGGDPGGARSLEHDHIALRKSAGGNAQERGGGHGAVNCHCPSGGA